MIELTSIEHATSPTSGVQLEHLFTSSARILHSPGSVGATPDGLQITFTIIGGEVAGPRLKGAMRAIGSDWLTLRPDGTGVLDLRIAIETGDGALIYAPYQSTLDHGPEAWDNGLRGLFATERTPFHIAPRFQSSDARYQWLHGLRCVGFGQIDLDRGELLCAFYAVT